EWRGDRGGGASVLVAVERAVVAEKNDEEREGCEADDDPEPLAQREIWVDPVDHRQPHRGEESAEGEQERVGVREREAEDHVRRYEEGEEEGCVGERPRRDDVLTGDVDGCETSCRQ